MRNPNGRKNRAGAALIGAGLALGLIICVSLLSVRGALFAVSAGLVISGAVLLRV